MNRYILVLILLLIFCCNYKAVIEPSISIINNKEVIDTGEIFTAKIYINNIDTSIYPQFYIVSENDTLMLAYDSKDICGIYNATGHKSRKHEINGFVDFKKMSGQDARKKYTIKFEIRAQ